MYEATKKKNEKLTGLDNQMVQVEADFEEMMRKRDEEKRSRDREKRCAKRSLAF